MHIRYSGWFKKWDIPVTTDDMAAWDRVETSLRKVDRFHNTGVIPFIWGIAAGIGLCVISFGAIKWLTC